MKHILVMLSTKYSKEFVWKFSATSHGKGVVDGVGGNVKSIVRRKSMSKGSNHIIVQDSLSFAEAAKCLVPETTTVLISEDEVEKYVKSKPFEDVKKVDGISKMHVMSVTSGLAQLWGLVMRIVIILCIIPTSPQTYFSSVISLCLVFISLFLIFRNSAYYHSSPPDISVTDYHWKHKKPINSSATFNAPAWCKGMHGLTINYGFSFGNQAIYFPFLFIL